MQIKAPNRRALFCSGSSPILFPSFLGSANPSLRHRVILFHPSLPQTQSTPQYRCLYIQISKPSSYSYPHYYHGPVPSTGATTAETWDAVAPRTLSAPSPSQWVYFDICLSDDLILVCHTQLMVSEVRAGGFIWICSLFLLSSQHSAQDLTSLQEIAASEMNG